MWNGIFKSYQVVEIIPVYEMSKEDWDLLDWGDLRNTAKNRIAESLDKDFLGFAKVNIFDKGRAKPNYMWPVSVGTAAAVAAGDTSSLGFGNEAEADDLTEKALALDNGVTGLESAIMLYGVSKIVKYTQEKAKEEDLRDELSALFDGGFEEDFDALEQALAIALELVKYKGYDWLESFIDDADEALGFAEDVGLI